MKLKDLLSKEQLEQIKIIGDMSTNLKFSISGHGTMNLEAQEILTRIVDSDAESLMRDIVDDVFFEHINKETDKRKR